MMIQYSILDKLSDYQTFREDFISMNVDEKSSWDNVKIQIMDKEAFMAISEEQAFKMFRYV